MQCCCDWGAAVGNRGNGPPSGEFPEFDCGLCPKHGYGPFSDGNLTLNAALCKRHKKIVQLYSAKDMGGKCSTCTNSYDRLYVRSRAYASHAGARFCIHCIDLQNTTAGRGGGRGGMNVEKPRNQPTPSVMHGVSGICIACGTNAIPRYSWSGQTFNACGWAHAGMFMDAVMDILVGPEGSERERRELAEGEEYVRKSLGIE